MESPPPKQNPEPAMDLNKFKIAGEIYDDTPYYDLHAKHNVWVIPGFFLGP